MRVVVVGASSGLGRCIGIGLAERGDQVALLARRQEHLYRAATEAGGDTLAISCDVTDVGSCRSAVDRVVEELGGIGAVLYCTGSAPLAKIEELDTTAWHQAFATNVVGANEFTRVVLPHLRESQGTAAYLSSVSASLTAPWPGLAAYTVTKAALDKLVEAWRAEHPEVGFTRIVVGECVGGQGDGQSHMTDAWDGDLATAMFPLWAERGLITDKFMDVDHLIDVVGGVLRVGASATIPTVAITPRRPI